MHVLTLLNALWLLGAPPEPSSPATPAADGYCARVRGEADAEAARLRAPELFVSGGTAGGAESLDGDLARKLGARVMAGVAYDVVGLREGALVAELGEVECARKVSLSLLEPFLRMGSRLGAEVGLTAELQALEVAEAEAGRRLEAERARVDRFQSSLDRVRRLEAWSERYRSARDRVRRELNAMPRWEGRATRAQVERALEAYLAADARLTELRGSVRHAQAFRFQLRGGYDRWFGQTQSVPLFGSVTLAFNTGRLFEGDASARAEAGTAIQDREDFDAVTREVAAILGALERERAESQRRLEDLERRVATLGALIERLAAVPDREVDAMRDDVELERLSLTAELAQLRARGRYLSEFFVVSTRGLDR